MEIMREEKEVVANWPFSRWEEEELPSPEELMPLSQTLITPDLAIAFDIPPTAVPCSHGGPSSSTLKKPRLVWTPHLHKRFVEAVAHLGIKNAVPKTIMQLMSVDGLTRENVASHLQKYRLYLKRMQHHHHHHNTSASLDSSTATDRLFAMAPAPSQLMLRPFVPAIAAMQQQHYHHNGMGVMHVIPPHLGVQRMASMSRPPPPPPPPYVENLGSGGRKGIRRVLTLFPTGEEED